jgi:pimeloyl-ACP methyl ester carboxylesterase
VPGTRNVSHTTIVGASHFLQEDRPDAFARAIVDFLLESRLTGKT